MQLSEGEGAYKPTLAVLRGLQGSQPLAGLSCWLRIRSQISRSLWVAGRDTWSASSGTGRRAVWTAGLFLHPVTTRERRGGQEDAAWGCAVIIPTLRPQFLTVHAFLRVKTQEIP